MVQRDRSHPSIILWSLGNESGDGCNLAACREWIQAADPSRPIQYESGGNLMNGTGQTDLTDVICPMYFSPADIEAIAVEGYNSGNPPTPAALRSGKARPLVLCEYSHAMGNSNGNLDEYWALFNSTCSPLN
jgi:beta-galactosidase